MTERPGAFVLTMEAGGAIHLVSDLPKRISVSKVLWDALDSGSHPKARIELHVDPNGHGEWVQDMVIETVECTFRYRRVEHDTEHDHYICELVSRTEPECSCPRIDVSGFSRQPGVDTVRGRTDPGCLVHRRPAIDLSGIAVHECDLHDHGFPPQPHGPGCKLNDLCTCDPGPEGQHRYWCRKNA